MIHRGVRRLAVCNHWLAYYWARDIISVGRGHNAVDHAMPWLGRH